MTKPPRSPSTAASITCPLLYAAGDRLPGDEVTRFNDTLDGALTMTSVLYGDASLLTGIA